MRRTAFTLSEVLVAVMVTAIVVPLTLRALQAVAGLDESSRRQAQAASLADLKLREMVVTGDWATAEDAGAFDDYPGYRWELHTEEVTLGEVALRRLEMTVFGPGRGQPSAATLVTLVAPAEEGP